MRDLWKLERDIMSLVIQMENPPIQIDESGALRVGNSRVLLELVIRAFKDGTTPETIVQRYSTTTLADVYGVISYYLNHKEDIENYLLEREEKAGEVQRKIESSQKNLGEIRNRLQKQRSK